MSTWPRHAFYALEALAAALALALTVWAGWLVVDAATGLPVPSWAWALTTAIPAAAVSALWRDLPVWATRWLNWRADVVAHLEHRFGITHTHPSDDEGASR